MNPRLALASMVLALGGLCACADASAFVEELPAGVSVISFNASGAEFNCTSEAFDNGNCAKATDGYCPSIGKVIEDGIGVLPDESVGAHLGWVGVGCMSRWKDIS
ncbi:MAG: hypothetical protein AAGL96_08290 [Pseudomonadota bacterium]